MGRYSEAETTTLADWAFASISAILGDKSYLMGDRPLGADATVYAFVSGALCPAFETPVRTRAEFLSKPERLQRPANPEILSRTGGRQRLNSKSGRQRLCER